MLVFNRRAVNRFVNAFGRDGKDTGSLVLTSAPTAPGQEVRLSGQLAEFYAALSFDKLTVGGEFFLWLFPLTQLPKAQMGWRWVTKHPSKEATENPNWNPAWVVFGDRNGDAIFAKQETEACPVFGRLQGTEFQLASSLESFLNTLSDCLLMEQLEYNFATQDEDFTVHQSFIDSTRQIVLKYESEEVAEEYVNFFFG